MLSIYFDKGTLILKGDISSQIQELLKKYVKFDSRIKQFRAKAYHYANIIRILHTNKFAYKDNTKKYNTIDLKLSTDLLPYKHQEKALSAWSRNQKQGLVVLPTGSGKSFLAVMAISQIKRSTLIVVPTIDLMQQWASTLERFFECKVGLLGGGSKEILDITISTYDSAVIMMEYIGNQFGFLIFDECHHLPTLKNKMSAVMSIAPFRLGLTATPERNDNGEHILYDIIGKLVYRIDIDQLEGSILSSYIVKRIQVKLNDTEKIEYQENRQIYKNFINRNNINFNSLDGWNNFINLCARQPDGREAFEAYLNQKRIARTSQTKFDILWQLLKKHPNERTIIFTADNNTAYDIGKRFLFPVITHHTKVVERKDFLDKFRNGDYPVLVTSKVLNEGIDVPEASIGIIVSGSGSIREHVQRLGRILRSSKDKKAYLYELISEGTSEYYISKRRGKHRAYKRFN